MEELTNPIPPPPAQQGSSPPPPPPIAVHSQEMKEILGERESLSARAKIGIIAVVGIVFLLILGGGLYLYSQIAQSPKNINTPSTPTRNINAINTSVQDSDNDGLTDDRESTWGTDPQNPDTDGDGYRDGDEVKNGYSPRQRPQQ